MTSAPETGQAGDSEAQTKTPKYDWDDPGVPAGNAPAMPRWPLIVSALAFSLWLVFLLAMAVLRIKTTAY